MLLHLNYYQMMCDNCGKIMCNTNKTELKTKWESEGGYYLRGNLCFCSKECYKLYNERLRNEANH